MKLVSCSINPKTYIGLVHNGKVLDLTYIAQKEGHAFPEKMKDFLYDLQSFEATAQKIDTAFKAGDFHEYAKSLDQVPLLAPIPNPTSCRDGYAFRQHVATARRNRGVEMIPEFDEYPIFYYTNHLGVTGPGLVYCMADHFQQLDFELECAVVLGKGGRNIDARHADDFIFGYTIMNDFSARVLQMEEMKLNLGPAKGKDFATAIGPMLVTKDELASYRLPAKPGHIGEMYNLEMKCRVNGKQVSYGNLADMDWTFAEIIERCSYGVNIYPSEVIGSGTVGTGCFLELNGTGKLNDPNYPVQWLKENDIVELEITGLGVLSNTVVKEGDASILKKKHKTR